MYRQTYPDAPGMHNTRTRYNPNVSRPILQSVKKHLVNVIIGFVLFNVSVAIGFWNESVYIERVRALDEGLSIIHTVESSFTVFEENHHKLIHVTGPLITAQPVFDLEFNISLSVAMLKRNVFIYQWVESEHRSESHFDGQTIEDVSYSYDKAWKSDLINHNSFNNRFGHENPQEVEINKQLFVAENVMCGNYHLSSEFIEKITNFKAINIPKNHQLDPKYTILEGDIFKSLNPLKPQVGDIMITFEVAGVAATDNLYELRDTDTVSIIGMQDKIHIVPFKSETGGLISLLQFGEYSASLMFKSEHMGVSLYLWWFRLLSCFLIFIAFSILFPFSEELAPRYQFLAQMVTLGRSTLCGSCALLVCLMVTGVSWLLWRPAFSAILFGVALAPILALKLRRRRVVNDRTV